MLSLELSNTLKLTSHVRKVFTKCSNGVYLGERSVKDMCQKVNRSERFKSLDWQKRVALLCRSNWQLGQRTTQISPGIDPELLTGGGEARQNS